MLPTWTDLRAGQKRMVTITVLHFRNSLCPIYTLTYGGSTVSGVRDSFKS